MNSGEKSFTIIVFTLIICFAGLVCLGVVHSHIQTIKYIEGGYSQESTNVGMRWVRK